MSKVLGRVPVVNFDSMELSTGCACAAAGKRAAMKSDITNVAVTVRLFPMLFLVACKP